MEENESLSDPFEMDLEEVQEALDQENGLWQQQGLSMQGLNMNNLPAMIIDIQVKQQALINVLITSGIIDEADLNLQYKRILLNDLRALRAAAPQQRSDAIRARILDGIHTMRPPTKPPWEN